MIPRNKLRSTIRGFTLFLEHCSRRTKRHRVELFLYRTHWSKFSDALVHSADAAGTHLALEAELHQFLWAQSAIMHRLLEAEEQDGDTSPSPVLARGKTTAKKAHDLGPELV